jgi:site-specific DNA-cytosine methylase
MNVLSLFDGISCAMVALERAGIKVDNYYASEINKYALQVSQKNYPDIIQLGDITKLDSEKIKQLGNGFTVDVVAHILKNIPLPYENIPL